MKSFLLLTFLLIGVTAYGQDTIQYFDKDWKPVSTDLMATYYRKVERTVGGFVVRDHLLSNNQLQMEAECSAVVPELKYDGICKRFYENGALESAGKYINSQEDGLWRTFYESGKSRDEIYYSPGEKGPRAKYHQHWAETGNQELVNGTGIYKSWVGDDGIACWFDVQDSTLIGSFYDDSGDTVYIKAEHAAEYQGGFPKFYKAIGETIYYPKQARRMGIEGRVFVSFVIDKNGKPRDPEVLRGIGAGCDEESVRVVMLQQNWQPAVHRGKPVNQKMVLPVVYKLN